MSKGAKPKDVFDVGRIRQIIELMEQHELVEVDLQEGDEKIKLKRGGEVQMVAAPMAPAPAAAPAPASTAAAAPQRITRLVLAPSTHPWLGLSMRRLILSLHLL